MNLSLLVAWDADGNIVATKDHMVLKVDGQIVGLIDFLAHEEAGGRLRDIWKVSNAVGSGVWPEWIGAKAHDFTVELDPNPGNARAKIAALVHKKSGHRRERVEIEAEIERRIVAAKGEPADIRDVVGGPGKPLLLDEDGKTRKRVKVARPNLPVVSRNVSRTPRTFG